MHTNIRHKKISHKCQYCNNTFSDEEDLSMHINIKHRKISHKCENCDNSFSDEEDLKLHINVKHGTISSTKTNIDITEVTAGLETKVHEEKRK